MKKNKKKTNLNRTAQFVNKQKKKEVNKFNEMK